MKPSPYASGLCFTRTPTKSTRQHAEQPSSSMYSPPPGNALDPNMA